MTSKINKIPSWYNHIASGKRASGYKGQLVRGVMENTCDTSDLMDL